jgi:hypothetical protein
MQPNCTIGTFIIDNVKLSRLGPRVATGTHVVRTALSAQACTTAIAPM